jgi:hypothetical protein
MSLLPYFRMKPALLLLASNLTSLACAVGAILLALNGIAGWGWFLAIALMTTSYYSSNNSN